MNIENKIKELSEIILKVYVFVPVLYLEVLTEYSVFLLSTHIPYIDESANGHPELV